MDAEYINREVAAISLVSEVAGQLRAVEDQIQEIVQRLHDLRDSDYLDLVTLGMIWEIEETKQEINSHRRKLRDINQSYFDRVQGELEEENA